MGCRRIWWSSFGASTSRLGLEGIDRTTHCLPSATPLGVPNGLSQLTAEDVLASLRAELTVPRRALPPDSVYPALLGREKEAAQWIHDRVSHDFMPTPEETVGVNKSRHGLRPVAVWDIPSRVAYRALSEILAAGLPPLRRSRPDWRAFQWSPLQEPGDYIVASDITACYQHIDHGLLATELRVQVGHHATIDSVLDLLQRTGGRSYGLPQQSHASDLLAEPFLARLQRALVRRRLTVARYNDDFLFTCSKWSDAVRAIEVFEEESRKVGLTVNDLKTVTWKRGTYQQSLEAAAAVREEVASAAQLDLAALDGADPYDGSSVDAGRGEIDRAVAERLLRRWAEIAARGRVARKHIPEHRAVVELIPGALAQLDSDSTTDAETLGICTQLLRFERTLTPAVGHYLASRSDSAHVLAAFDVLIRRKAYLNGWQTWWLQQPVARLDGFASGSGAKARTRWASEALTSAEHSPVLRGEAARTLARHKLVSVKEMLAIYDRSSNIVRPVLAAGIALLKPPAAERSAIVNDDKINEWVFDWSAQFA